MMTKIILAILLAIPGVAAAQEKLADQLRKAIVEEEVNQRLDKAIEGYTRILAQYDEDRKVAASALFHFAECCRKLGKQDQATAAYERVAREFADQKDLAEASRRYLPPRSRPGSIVGGMSAEQVAQLRLLQEMMGLVERKILEAERRVEIGIAKPNELIDLEKELIEVKLRIEEVRRGGSPTPGPLPRPVKK